MKRSKHIFILFCPFLFLTCKTGIKHEKKEIYVNRIVYATGGCYGQCPIQVIDIDSSLTFYYEGVKFTKDSGLFKGNVSLEFWNQLNLNLKKNRFKNLDSNYFESVDDQSIEIMIYYDHKVKRICAQERSAHIQIQNFIRWFDEEFKSMKFKKYKATHCFPTKYQIPMNEPLPDLNSFFSNDR